MDDLIMLKWFAYLIMLAAVACALTIFSPFGVAARALIVLGTGRERTELIVVGVLLLVPPTAWFTMAFSH